MDENLTTAKHHVVVAVRGQEDCRPLLHTGYTLAKGYGGSLTVVTVRQTDLEPIRLQVPSEFSDIPIEIEAIQSKTPAQAILKYVRKNSPDLLVVGWKGTQTSSGHMLGRTLDPLFLQIPCNMIVVKAEADWPDDAFLSQEKIKILIPTAGGPNTPLALNLALNAAKSSKITALYVMPEAADKASVAERERWLADLVKPWAYTPDVETKVIQANTILKGVVAEAAEYDITMLGATKVSIFNQLLFGVIPHKIATENSGTTILVKQSKGDFESFLRRLWWQATHFLPKLTMDERIEVYKQIRRGARPKIDFFMMIGLAAGIAALGLLLNSPAVIIGAMLVAPLMSAIVGIGLGTVQADGRLLGLALSATLRGVSLAIVMGLIMGLFIRSVVDEPTAEMMSRVSPNLLDLGVALISGFAGAYALCRKNLSSSLPGVAIAVALVPPLATAGIGLAWFDWQIATGAMVLFFTNMVAISAASGFVFFLLGFRPDLRHGREIFKRAVFSSLILLFVMALILWWLSVDHFRDAAHDRVINQSLTTNLNQMTQPVTMDHWQIVKQEDTHQGEGELAVIEDGDTFKLEVQVRSANKTPSFQDVTRVQTKVAEDLRAAKVLKPDQPFSLVLVVILTTALDPLFPPTQTPLPAMTETALPKPSAVPSDIATATFTATPTPTATFTPVPVFTATPSPSSTPDFTATFTVTPLPTVTPTGTATFTPVPTHTPALVLAVVANTGGRGVKLRWIPGGTVAGALSEGTPVQLLYNRQAANGITWIKIADALGRTGWVAEEYLAIPR